MTIPIRFQSRNRETYDSNHPLLRKSERLFDSLFQSRNRETYDSNITCKAPKSKI